MNGALIYAAFGVAVLWLMRSHLRRMLRQEAAAVAAADRAKLAGDGPRAQHPRIDVSNCIGCGACILACPEGDVLALLAGKAAIVNGHKCIGHGLCADACPVGAIEIVMASPSMAADLPVLSPELETNVPGLYIVGELGGLALIKNAINQGRDVVDTIAGRLVRAGGSGAPRAARTTDVCVVGAGPGGISASLRAIERRLSCVTIEQDEFGGTVARYPRQKLVMTSPVELPVYGKFKKLQLSKEDLLRLWDRIRREAGLTIRAGERVQQVTPLPDRTFTVVSTAGEYRARTVVLALGRRGSPRKLEIPGEALPKVMYSLLDAEAYRRSRVLVVGGGDSAVETALGLAHQRGNTVTLSYRKDSFMRIKQRNADRIQAAAKSGKVNVLFNSQPLEICPQSVRLEVGGRERELPNDYVWVLAGTLPPNEFLRQCGVQVGQRDLTDMVRAEAAALA
jgi:thioredoxin reductase/Pyruvate/2-oxoacid:ferredoxin oxidoreductase delta subunit